MGDCSSDILRANWKLIFLAQLYVCLNVQSFRDSLLCSLFKHCKVNLSRIHCSCSLFKHCKVNQLLSKVQDLIPWTVFDNVNELIQLNVVGNFITL